MKPLNHKERNSALGKFSFSFLPVIMMSAIGILLFCMIGSEHKEFVKEKHKLEKEKFRELAEVGESIDTILSYTDRIIIENMKEHEYKKVQKLISKTVDSALEKEITKKNKSPFKAMLKEVKSVQTILDSIHVDQAIYNKKAEQLRKCIEFYEDYNLTSK